jgi:hypothetical protein
MTQRMSGLPWWCSLQVRRALGPALASVGSLPMQWARSPAVVDPVTHAVRCPVPQSARGAACDDVLLRFALGGCNWGRSALSVAAVWQCVRFVATLACSHVCVCAVG